MGFFDKIAGAFEKKQCDICGGEIGLLGNKKLENGNCCKECVKKLSPWFTDRKHSTVEEIREQIEYREQNREELKDFHETVKMGEDSSLFLIDQQNRRFVVLPRSNVDLYAQNPDIIYFDQVNEMKLDISYSSSEEKMMRDGQRVSYDPPRYEHSFTFYVKIVTNHPYAHEHRCQLNGRSLKVHTAGPKMDRSYRLDALEDLSRFLDYYPPLNYRDRVQVDREMDDCYYFANMGDEICRTIMRG